MWERTDSQEVGLEAAIFQRKRNSSLVKRSCAENTTGLKLDTEATGSSKKSGRGAFSRRYMPDGNDRFRPREELMQA
jgi:hypothetical protein